VGPLRRHRRAFRTDPPSPGDIARATRSIAEAFDDITPPRPLGALAVGGTARALRRVAGEPLGPHDLADAVDELSLLPARQIAKTFKLDRQRARTITAGALILGEIQRRLNVPLEIGRGGLREGAALQLLDATVAATA
jgi:exopolyphosphatase/guanosine-5'-triphosphate,3'-diphosphate pyrophosphatase